jgi:hypothetical protein
MCKRKRVGVFRLGPGWEDLSRRKEGNEKRMEGSQGAKEKEARSDLTRGQRLYSTPFSKLVGLVRQRPTRLYSSVCPEQEML